MSASVARFGRSERGAIVPLFAIMLLTVLSLSGVAIDYARGLRIKGRLDAAADAATLAAARAAANLALQDSTKGISLIEEEAAEVGTAFFRSNTAELSDIDFGKPDLKVQFRDGGWTATLKFKATAGTTLSSVMSGPTLDLSGRSETTISPGYPVLDIAMCIDSTGSMTPTLDAVKSNALAFYDNINLELQKRGLSPFPAVRVRMIFFKDYGDYLVGIWDVDPQRPSDFYALPSDASSFKAFADPQVAWNGGDTPESGLECLNEAMDSQWIKVGDPLPGSAIRVTDVYPIIAIWTDAPAHPLPFPNSLANPNYPDAAKMPRTYEDLLEKWNDPQVIDQANKQIIFFGDPDVTSYDMYSYPSGWPEIKKWPRFTIGGGLTEANVSFVEFLAKGIARGAKGLKITN